MPSSEKLTAHTEMLQRERERERERETRLWGVGVGKIKEELEGDTASEVESGGER